MARWLITGCSTGIGREIARAALEAGHQRRRHGTHGRKRCRTSSTTFGDRALAVALDVTDRGQIDAAVTAAHDAFGGIDVLVNNAGYGYMSAVEEGDDAEVRKLFDTNYFGVVDTIKAVLPAMRAQAVRSHHQHLVDDRAGGQPAQRLLLVDQVRARGAHRGARARRSDRSASR